NYRDEEVSETPWGPDVPVHRSAGLSGGLRAALERYRLARAARRGGGDGDSGLDAIAPIAPSNPVRNIRIKP
ncbi:MAG: hypothetical protein ACREMT_05375, partial [Vulcanimicrobiaceae bacterium]